MGEFITSALRSDIQCLWLYVVVCHCYVILLSLFSGVERTIRRVYITPVTHYAVVMSLVPAER